MSLSYHIVSLCTEGKVGQKKMLSAMSGDTDSEQESPSLLSLAASTKNSLNWTLLKLLFQEDRKEQLLLQTGLQEAWVS